MAYDEILADRVRKILHDKQVRFDEKKMFGGLCYMVKSKMCLGVVKDELMVRMDPDLYEDALTKEGCREMVFSGRPMKGFVFVHAGDGRALAYWIQLALDFNPKAKSSKKK